MKKHIIKLAVLLIAFTALISSCKKIDEITDPVENRKNPYEHVGKLHNDFLTNVKNNFDPNMEISNLEDGFDFITDFHISYVLKSNLNSAEKSLYVSSLNEYKRFVKTSDFYNEFFISTSKDDDMKYWDYIDIALSIGLIDNFEFEQLTIIGEALVDGYYGILTDYEFAQTIVSVENRWKLKYPVNCEEGNVLAVTLALSTASIEWWEANPDAFENGNAKLPPVVGADVAGAVIGGVIAGVNSYINTGEVSWGGVAIGAGAGAVTGSTGVVGKVGKWISKLF
jgi:hypothetical protein